MIRAKYINIDGSSGFLSAPDWEKLVEQLDIEMLKSLSAVKVEEHDDGER